MGIKDIVRKSQLADSAAIRERLQAPEIVQKTKAVRHSHSRIAYCKNDAGEGTTIVCYLDKDGTGTEIIVHCSIASVGSNLNTASPLLKAGNKIFVENIQEEWWCTCVIFMPYEECVCTPPA